MVTFRDLFLLLTVLGDNHPHDTFPLAEKNLHAINLVLQQENIKSILSGMLIDKTLQADTVLHNSKNKIYDTHEPLSFFTSILHTLEENAAHVKQLGNELYTVIDIIPSYFDILGEDINKGMRTEMFTADQIFERVPEKTLEQERIKKTEEQIEKNIKKKKHIAAEERRKEFLKLIEEQNLTAHEKASNERRLIDFFF